MGAECVRLRSTVGFLVGYSLAQEAWLWRASTVALLAVCVVGTWWPAIRAANKQQRRAEPLRSNTAFSATTSPSPKLTLSRRSPAVGRRWCTHKTRAAHRSPAARRRSSGSGQDQPHTTASRQTRRASTCSLSPAAFRLTLAGRGFISGGFMGAEGRRCGASGRGTSDWTQATCPELVPAAGSTFSTARSELACCRQPPFCQYHQVRHINNKASACVFQNKSWFGTYLLQHFRSKNIKNMYTVAACINFCFLHVLNTVCIGNERDYQADKLILDYWRGLDTSDATKLLLDCANLTTTIRQHWLALRGAVYVIQIFWVTVISRGNWCMMTMSFKTGKKRFLCAKG